MWDGYQVRKENKENMFAYFTCRLMNLQLKNPISPAELLKPIREPEDQQEKKKADEEYMKKRFKNVPWDK